MAGEKHQNQGLFTDKSLPIPVEKLKEEAARWENLGVRLGVPYHVLQRINTNPGASSIDQKFKKVIYLWMAFKPEERTWDRLANSIEKCHKSLALNLKEDSRYKDGGTVNLTMNEYCDILDPLRASWRQFGIHLGISYYDLQAIADSLKTSDCLTDMLIEWISHDPTQASLPVLCEALEKVKNKALAYRLKDDDEICAELGGRSKGKKRDSPTGQ